MLIIYLFIFCIYKIEASLAHNLSHVIMNSMLKLLLSVFLHLLTILNVQEMFSVLVYFMEIFINHFQFKS